MNRMKIIGIAALSAAVLSTITLYAAPASASIDTFFGTTVPPTKAANDDGAVSVGTKFTTKADGRITGIRFYKGSGNGGTHVVALYSSTGVLLVKATATGETATGWQTVGFAGVTVAAGTYTAVVFDPRGHYPVQAPYTWPKTSGNLKGSAGVYRYGSSVGYPTSTYNRSNYFVDVNFSASATASPTPSSPAPTVSPSQSASVSPSPTPTQSPSVSPSPVPIPTPSPAAPQSGFPDASTTGYQHTGVTLRTVKVGDSGPGWSAESVGGSPVFYVRSAGAVIDSLNIPMCVKILANNVIIKRSRVACASYYTINVSDPPTYYSGLTLSDVEIDGLSDTSTPGIAVMASSGATYTRINVHGFGSSGPRLASGTTLQDSYIHGFVCSPPDHSAGTSANDGGSGIAILRNNIDIATGAAGCASAAIGIDPDFGNYNGVQVIGNRVAGGAYCLYTAQNQGAANVRVEGNTFARTYYPHCGQYGPVAQVQSGNGNTYLGNVYDDGTPAGP
jgi:hypothetical protein